MGWGCCLGAIRAEDRPWVPVISEDPADWWRICEMPDLGALAGPDPERQHIVDHGFIRDANGTWQLWACLRGTAVSRLIFGWQGKALTLGPWTPMGVKLRAREAFDERIRDGAETVGAPYFFKKDGRYFCLYHSGGMHLLESSDGIHYTRVRMPDGSWETGIPGGRDVHVLKVGDTWYSYATVTDYEPGMPRTRENLTSWVVAATSRDFQTWEGAHIVSKGGLPGSGPVDAESPFVLYKDGYFYLTRSSSITFKTYIYRSKDPLDFGIDDDSKMVAIYDIKAPEIIHHSGKWYISDLHDFQGIRLTELRWESP